MARHRTANNRYAVNLAVLVRDPDGKLAADGRLVMPMHRTDKLIRLFKRQRTDRKFHDRPIHLIGIGRSVVAISL